MYVYTVRFAAYCGMSDVPSQFADKSEARATVASRLRRARRRGCPIDTLVKGEEWEIQEPEGCAMVPDFCGMLTLRETWQYEAPCGGSHNEDREGDCGECAELFTSTLEDEC